MTTIKDRIKQKAMDAVIILSMFMITGVYSCSMDAHTPREKKPSDLQGYFPDVDNIKSKKP